MEEDSDDHLSVLSPFTKAINKAAEWHRNQVRKISNVPFIVHPLGTAWIVSRYTDDETTIIAAFLHDGPEDVPSCTFKILKQEFGERVASIVREVSEEKDPRESRSSKKKTWRTRKITYLKNLRNASQPALMVCCADKIHNLLSLLADYEEFGDSILEKLNSPPDQQLWYYQSVFQILSDRLDNDIVDELEKVLLQVIQRKIFNC